MNNIDLLANNYRIIHTIGYDKSILHENGFATLERNYEFNCWMLTRHYNTGSLNDTDTTLHKDYDEALKLYSQYKDTVEEYDSDSQVDIFFKASTWKRMFDVLENGNLLYFVQNEDQKWAIAEIEEDEYIRYDLKDLQALVNGYIGYTYRGSIEDEMNGVITSLATYFIQFDEDGRSNGNYNNKLFDVFLKEFYRFKRSFEGYQGHIVFGKAETLTKKTKRE